MPHHSLDQKHQRANPGLDQLSPIGSYKVDPDCTGSFFDADGIKTNNVVVLDGGKKFLLLSVMPDTIATEEGARLETED